VQYFLIRIGRPVGETIGKQSRGSASYSFGKTCVSALPPPKESAENVPAESSRGQLPVLGSLKKAVVGAARQIQT
jgi:hypothetical protein